MPLRDHLTSLWRQSGVKPKQLVDAPSLPKGTEYLWADFLELHDERGFTEYGPMRITSLQIDAWQRVNDFKLQRWEIKAIKKLDDAYLKSYKP